MAVCEHIVRKANSMAKKIGFLKMLNYSIVNFMYACAHTHYNTDTHTILNVHNSSFFEMHVTMSNKFGSWKILVHVWHDSQNSISKWNQECVWIKSEYFIRKRQTKTQVKQRNYFSTKKKLKKAAVIDSCCSAINLFEDTTLKHTHLHTTKKIKLELKTLKIIWSKKKSKTK